MKMASLDKLSTLDPGYFPRTCLSPNFPLAHSGEVGVTHLVGGERLDLREVRVEIQPPEVILQQIPNSQREIIMPEMNLSKL